MDNFTNYLDEKIQPLVTKLDQNRYLQAIQSGFFGAMPVMIIGSIFLLLSNFPVAGYPEFMASIFGENWSSFFTTPFNMSMNILSLFIFFGIVKSLADYYETDVLGTTVVSLVGYLIINPTVVGEEGASGISMGHLGSEGLILSIITAIIAVEIYRWVVERGWTISMPEGVPPSVSRSFTTLIPGVFVILTFNIIRLIFSLTHYGTFYDFIYEILQAPLLSIGATLPAIIFIIFLESFLWAFGIHGSAVTSAGVGAVMLSLSAQNAEAFAAGEAIPNIINQQFITIFVNLGGSGATIGLVLLSLLIAKSKRYNLLGKLSIGPSVFMINEPVIFGFPIVLNPVMVIPFIITPVVMGLLTYFVMKIGLVPLTNGANIPWTTPPVIGGFLLSGWRGAVYQIFQILVTMGIYYPFFKMEDNKAYLTEQNGGDEA
ncbi:MAG: PTS sugar transporter subunit IIC [Atopostipes sp.]|nr:PTS sugar transporter subunit IIC [Atopostipes sp.]